MKFTVGAGGGFGDVAGRTQKTVKEVLKLIAEDCPRECHNCPACDEVKQECLTKLARHTLWKGWDGRIHDFDVKAGSKNRTE